MLISLSDSSQSWHLVCGFCVHLCLSKSMHGAHGVHPYSRVRHTWQSRKQCIIVSLICWCTIGREFLFCFAGILSSGQPWNAIDNLCMVNRSVYRLMTTPYLECNWVESLSSNCLLSPLFPTSVPNCLFFFEESLALFSWFFTKIPVISGSFMPLAPDCLLTTPKECKVIFYLFITSAHVEE